MQIKEFDCITINPSPLIPIAERKEIDYIDTSSVTEGRLEKVQHLISDFPSRAQREVVANDILISSVRPNLRHNYYVKATEDGMIASSGFIHLRVNDTATIDSKFLYYYLTSPFYTKYYTAIADCSQSSYPSFNKDVIEDIVFPNISSKRQKRIAKVLSGLDDKIALNRKKIEKLEALAKTIYDYWFVQFDFPDANGRPYKSSGGKMVYNPILKREIPDGWEVSSLEKHVDEIVSGEWGNDESSEKAPFQVRCIRGADITDQSNLPIRYISESKQAKLLREGDIIIEMSGGSPTQATGRSCYVTNGLLSENHNMLTCSNFCSALRVLDENETAFFFYTWKLLYDAGVMFNFEGKTSGIKNLQVDSLLLSRWWFPPSDLSAMYNNLFVNLRMSVDSSRKEVRSLTSLRDFLLPLLMNGQVEVDE